MSISNNIIRDFPNGDGVAKTFSYTSKISDKSELNVYVNGVKKTLTSDYDVTNVGVETGGSVVFVVAPPAGSKLLFERRTPRTQNVKFTDNGSTFSADVFERIEDKNTAVVQEIDDTVSRALKFSAGSLLKDIDVPDLVANKALKVNAAGTGLEWSLTDVDAPVLAATEQANIATTQAGIATTKAGEASASAASALASKNAAATSETNAAASYTSCQSLVAQYSPTRIVREEANMLLTQERMLGLTGTKVQTLNGLVDAFNDLSGVDMALSYGWTYDPTNKWFTNIDPRIGVYMDMINDVNDYSARSLTMTASNVAYNFLNTYSGGYQYSAYFNGTSSYVTCASPGTATKFHANFTVEVTVTPMAYPAAGQGTCILDTRASTSSTNGLYIGLYDSAGFVYVIVGGATIIVNTVAVVPLGQASTIKVCRHNGIVYVFVNDKLYGSPQQLAILSDGYLNIGRTVGAASYFNGSITNLIITKDYSWYNNNYGAFAMETPNRICPNWLRTAMHTMISDGNDLNGSFTMSNNYVSFTTAPGTTYYTPPNMPLNASCAYFNLANACLVGSPTGNANAAKFGGDFCFETTIYPTAYPAASAWRIIADFRTAGASATGFAIGLYGASGNIGVFSNNGAIINSSFTVPLNTWSHIAVSRFGGTIYLWIDGKLAGSVANSTMFTDGAYRLGAALDATAYYVGYMGEVVIYNGYAKYTAPFNYWVGSNVVGYRYRQNYIYNTSVALISQPLNPKQAPNETSNVPTNFTIMNDVQMAPVSNASFGDYLDWTHSLVYHNGSSVYVSNPPKWYSYSNVLNMNYTNITDGSAVVYTQGTFSRNDSRWMHKIVGSTNYPVRLRGTGIVWNG